MSMADTKPGDIFTDKTGKRWFAYGICHEPTLFMEECEPAENATPARMIGGVSGLMWDGFTRISSR